MHARVAVILLALLAPASGSAAVFSVGTAPGCTHPTLAGALAAAVANGPGEDVILLSGPISGVAIDTSGTNLVLAGGYTNCAGTPSPSSRTVLTGNGIAPVIQTSGRNLTLRNLTITGGGTTDLVGAGDFVVGGGVSVTNGILDIDDSTIEINRATIGGGIAVTGANAVALIGGGTSILFNEARTGGGMYFAGSVLRISYTRPGAVIGFNRAVTLRGSPGKGGGLYVDRVTGTGGSTVFVGPLSWEIGQPFPPTFGFRLIDNQASGDGGGAYVSGSVIDLQESVISGNQAGSLGGGVHLDDSMLRMYRLDPEYLGLPTPKCQAGACTLLRGNFAFEGGAVFVSATSRAEIAQALVTENRAALGAAISSQWLTDPNPLRARIDGSVVARNRCVAGSSGGCGILRIGAGRAELRFVTFADNTFEPLPNPTNIMKGAGSLVVKSSILLPAADTISFAFSSPPPAITADCNAAPNTSLSGTRPLATAPTFPAAPASYRPDETSAAIDHCDGPTATESGYLDPNLESRGVDNPDRPNGFGVFDIGAYETQPLLRNGFE